MDEPKPLRSEQDGPERDRVFAQANAYYANLRRDPKAWEAFCRRQEAWGAIAGEGLPPMDDEEKEAAHCYERQRLQRPTFLVPFPGDPDNIQVNFGTLLIRLRALARFRTEEDMIAWTESLLLQEGRRLDDLLSVSQLKDYERGDCRTISPETLWLLAQAYDVDYAMLVIAWAEDRFQCLFSTHFEAKSEA